MHEELLTKQLSRRRLLQVAAGSAVIAALGHLGCDGDEKKQSVAPVPTSRATVSGPAVETMTGAISTTALGFTLMHEHIIVQSEGVSRVFPSVWDQQASLEKALNVLTDLKAREVDTLVDLTVYGTGRDILPLLPVVQKAGIQVIVATGIYTSELLPGYFENRSIDEMADLFVADITDGVQGTEVKAAIIKCATDAPGLTSDVEKVLRAAARSHLRTGRPITTHTHAATQRGLDQQRIFLEEGVDLKRVIIGHCGDSEDMDYLTKLIDAGSYIGMDRFGLEALLPDEKRVATVARLCQSGYAERMVLSQDACVYIDTYKPEVIRAFGENWNHFDIVDNIIPALLEAGVSQAQIDVMMRENPRRIFENVTTY